MTAVFNQPLSKVEQLIHSELEQKNTQEVNLIRKALILNWLYKYKISSREILFEVAHVEKTAGYRLIAKLVKQGYLRSIDSNYTTTNIFGLGKLGLGELISSSIVKDNYRLPSPNVLANIKLIGHELGLQKAVLGGLRYIERTKLIEHKISKEFETKGLRIDSLIDFSYIHNDEHKKLKVAVEFENSEKSRKRIEYLLVNHLKNIKNGLYDVVFLVFSSNSLRMRYAEILKNKPRDIQKNKKTGRLTSSIRYEYDKSYEKSVHFGLLKDDNTVELPNFVEFKRENAHEIAQKRNTSAVYQDRYRAEIENQVKQRLEAEYQQKIEALEEEHRKEVAELKAYIAEAERINQEWVEADSKRGLMGLFKGD